MLLFIHRIFFGTRFTLLIAKSCNERIANDVVRLELQLLRFIVDLEYNMLHNKSTANRNNGARALMTAVRLTALTA